jgi:hypothetical protein
MGRGEGKELLADRLRMFLQDFRVLAYDVRWLRADREWVDAQIGYHYLSLTTRMDIQGSQRHIWRVIDDHVVLFEVLHDAPRLAAFFDLVRAEAGR